MAEIPKLNIEPYVNIFLRRKWWIIIPTIVAIFAGMGYLQITPKVYRASTLVLVEPQRVPDAYVKSTVTESVESRLRTIMQQVYSRTNIESIIDQYGLDPQVATKEQGLIQKIKKLVGLQAPEQKNAPPNEDTLKTRAIEEIREKIEVSFSGRGKRQAFEIAFNWYDPEVTARVANGIASKFIQESVNVREEIAMTTTDFLERETARLRQELESREKELEDFKKEHLGMLPSELDSNINILNQLKEELNNLEKRIDSEKQMAMMLESQKQSPLMEAIPAGPVIDEEALTEDGTAGAAGSLEDQLKALRTRYTENHPDIIALKRQIELAKQEQRSNSSKSAAPILGSSMDLLGSPTDMLASQQEMIKSRIEGYEKQIEDVKKRMEVYKERVEGTARVDLAMTKITRDYDTVRERYDGIMSKLLNARMAEDLERRQKSEQFKVLDPAIRPQAPVEPKAGKVMPMAILLGLAAGCGLAFVREIMDPCFYSPEELEAVLGTPVILSLPVVGEKAGRGVGLGLDRFRKKTAGESAHV